MKHPPIWLPERVHFTQMSRYQEPLLLVRLFACMCSSQRLGLTRILIKHYTWTFSRCICRQAARFNWYLCRGNGVPLAYAAVSPSGSERRVEWSRQGEMRKSLWKKENKKWGNRWRVRAVWVEERSWRLVVRKWNDNKGVDGEVDSHWGSHAGSDHWFSPLLTGFYYCEPLPGDHMISLPGNCLTEPEKTDIDTHTDTCGLNYFQGIRFRLRYWGYYQL